MSRQLCSGLLFVQLVFTRDRDGYSMPASKGFPKLGL